MEPESELSDVTTRGQYRPAGAEAVGGGFISGIQSEQAESRSTAFSLLAEKTVPKTSTVTRVEERDTLTREVALWQELASLLLIQLGRTMRTPAQALLTFLWLQLDWGRAEQLEQLPSTLRVQEGDTSVINCTYSDSASSYFPWYRQEAGKGPQLIIDIRSNAVSVQKQRLLVSFSKTAKQVSLHITDTQPGDAAVYFCAASAQCLPVTCSLCENLPLACALCWSWQDFPVFAVLVCK
ncbi:uncharacterized protein LOC106028628 [Cavia porcellus]|uniref:uncharacterized protein LOC106028628 n=1 Tax=Cavia porcellus TaxID=10141 RepID=UPI00022B7B93